MSPLAAQVSSVACALRNWKLSTKLQIAHLGNLNGMKDQRKTSDNHWYTGGQCALAKHSGWALAQRRYLCEVIKLLLGGALLALTGDSMIPDTRRDQQCDATDEILIQNNIAHGTFAKSLSIAGATETARGPWLRLYVIARVVGTSQPAVR